MIKLSAREISLIVYGSLHGDENIMVTVYPVEYDDGEEVGFANTSEWVRLLVKDMKNNRIIEDWKVNA